MLFKKNKNKIIIFLSISGISCQSEALDVLHFFSGPILSPVVGIMKNFDDRYGRARNPGEIKNPSTENVKKILRNKLAKIKVSPQIDEKCMEELCLSMSGFSETDIESIVNKANSKVVDGGCVIFNDLNKAIEEKKKDSSPYIIKPENIKETFDSIVLDDGIKDNFKAIAEYIKNPEKFHKLGALPPKGILLYGPPGTGKTSLGRALAKESGATFLYAAGSEFDNMWIGTGAERMKELFRLAREYAPSIVFIDEIYTVARKRVDYEARYQSQTSQQLLVEMDGFQKGKDGRPVVVVGTTNNLEQLDVALLRSGRFDIHLEIKNPSPENLKKIFMKNLTKIKVSPEVDEKAISELCLNMSGFSGADIENVINKASLKAVMSDGDCVTLNDLKKAVEELKKQKSN